MLALTLLLPLPLPPLLPTHSGGRWWTVAAVAVSNDLGNNSGSRRRMMVDNNVSDDVGNDVGDGDDGSNNAGNNASKGDGRDDGGEGGEGLLVEDVAVAVVTVAAAAAYCWGRFLFIVKIFVCGIFMCEVWQDHTCPHILVMLEVCGILLGGDSNCPQKLWYVNTKTYLAKKHGNQSW
jgi:hypothetical protein